MVRILALYEGPNLREASLVAVSSEEDLVRSFAKELLLRDRAPNHDGSASQAVRNGCQRALEIIRDGG